MSPHDLVRRSGQTWILLTLICLSISCQSRVASSDAHSNSPVSPAPAISTPPASFADVVDRVSPAVVTIRSAHRVRASRQFPFFNDPFFRQFFGNRYEGAPQTPPPVMQALGSGVIVNSDGHIVTNHHVVDGADQITVELTDHRTMSAKLIGSDPPSDVAVLKIDANNLPVLPFADSDKVRVGDVCLAVGNPLGLGQTVTAGIISAKGRTTGLSDGSFEDFLQTDAAINHGNSGGALVNTRGELAGINSQIVSPSGGNIGIGFAIPSNMARSVTEQLTHSGKVSRGMLGVAIQPVTSDLARALNLKEVRGGLVSSVEPGSPAERAGLRPGDVVTAIDGTPISDPNALRNRIASTPPGTEVTLTVVRDGHEGQMKARLSALPTPQNAPPEQQSESGGDQLGLSVQSLSDDSAARMGLPRGTRGALIVAVDPSGRAFMAGIRPGDVILAVNHQPVQSPGDIRSALSRSGGSPMLLLINRAGRNLFVAIQPPTAG